MSTIVVGIGVGNFIYSIDDGSTWSTSAYPGFTNNFKVVSNGTVAIAVGESLGGDVLAVSSDGINWMGQSLGVGITTAGTVAYGNGRWLIGAVTLGGGPGATGYVFYSDNDGATWTSIGAGVSTLNFQGFAYNSTTGRWVGVGVVIGGNPFIAYSDDNGLTWTDTAQTVFGVSEIPSGVAWNGSYWVATSGTNTPPVATNIFATSPNGINWTGQGSTAGGIQVFAAYNPTWNGSLWVAAGSSDTPSFYIFTSPDGSNWTARNTGFDSLAVGVVWSGTRWIVGGNSFTNFSIETSADTLVWDPKTTPIPTVSSLAVLPYTSPPVPPPAVPSQPVVAQEFQNIHLPSHNNIVPYYRGAVVPGIPNIQPPPPGTFKEPRQAKNVINRCFGSLVPNKNVPDPCAHPRSPHEKRDIQKNCSGVIPVADYNARLNNYQRPFGTYQVGFQQSPKAKTVATWPPLP